MNVCVITSGELPVPATRGGAIEQLVELLIDGNERENLFNLTVIGVFDSKLENIYLTKKHTVFINYHQGYIDKNKFASFLRNKFYRACNKIGIKLWRIIPYYKFVAQVLQKDADKFDFIVNEGFSEMNVYSQVVRRLGKNRLIFHLHAHTLSSILIERIFGGAISISDFVKKEFIDSQTIHIPTITLYNAVDISRFNRAKDLKASEMLRLKYGLEKDDFIILFCGRIVPEKGVLELVNTVNRITDKKVKLLIVGSSAFEGASMSGYQEKVLKVVHASKGRISVAGYVDNLDIFKFHQISTIAVFPAIWEEGFCVSLVETMASGLPSIVSRSGGMVEVATEETSVFINKTNIEEDLYKAILMLMNNTDRLNNMSLACRERSLLFDGNDYAQKFYNVLSQFTP